MFEKGRLYRNKRRWKRKKKNLDSVIFARPRLEQLRKWTLDNAPVRSGTPGRRYFRFGTWTEAWLKYRRDCRSSNPIGITHFRQILRKYRVRPHPFDKYACPICWGPEKGDARKAHEKILETQYKVYQSQRDGLQSNQCIVLIDFCKFHETAKFKFSCLGIVVLLNKCRTGSTHELVEEYYDYCAVNTKQDGNFIRKGLRHFARDFDLRHQVGQTINEIIFWSDGGFKSYGTMAAYSDFCSLLGKKAKTRWHIFPPYHGHSRADAHFGRIKRALRRKFAGSIIEKPEDIFNVIKSQKNVHAELFDSVQVVFGQIESNRPWVDSNFAYECINAEKDSFLAWATSECLDRPSPASLYRFEPDEEPKSGKKRKRQAKGTAKVQSKPRNNQRNHAQGGQTQK